jgi:hypothetical protein
LSFLGYGLRKLEPQLNNVEHDKVHSQGYFDSVYIAKSEIESFGIEEDLSRTLSVHYAKFYQSIDDLKPPFPKATRFLDVRATTGDMGCHRQIVRPGCGGDRNSDFVTRHKLVIHFY